MSDFVTKLQNYIIENGIDSQIIRVNKASTVKEAAASVGCSRREIIKSVVFLAGDEAIVAIVDGSASVDRKRVEKVLGKDVRIAERDEVLNFTGFPAGGVPPVGHGCRILLDERVLNNERVYGGGGDEEHLLLISTSDIAKEGEIVKIRK